MPNRIEQKFKELRRLHRKAFIAFVTAGDPHLTATKDLAVALAKAGVDILELGVPFSDPLADGPTIQEASQRALKGGVTLGKILRTVTRIRKQSSIPIALMTYYNPVFRYGEARFLRQARAAGVDGLIIPDLPPEEARDLIRAARREGIALIFFLSPTTTPRRMVQVIRQSTGFIYFVSVTGVTGARRQLPSSLVSQVQRARRLTDKPVCVGFGVSTSAQVAKVAQFCDGVIVGSAIVKQIARYGGKRDGVKRVARFVSSLTRVLK